MDYNYLYLQTFILFYFKYFASICVTYYKFYYNSGCDSDWSYVTVHYSADSSHWDNCALKKSDK